MPVSWENRQFRHNTHKVSYLHGIFLDTEKNKNPMVDEKISYFYYTIRAENLHEKNDNYTMDMYYKNFQIS